MAQENVIKFQKPNLFDLRLKLLKEARERYARRLKLREKRVFSNDNKVFVLRIANKELKSQIE